MILQKIHEAAMLVVQKVESVLTNNVFGVGSLHSIHFMLLPQTWGTRDMHDDD